ncbi:site-specific integrase, partial [Granulosicoccus sp.]|nr:site-specific integrase [Granulosicoccus sp.]
MAWISYRKVINEPKILDLDWLDFAPPKLKNNKRWPFIIAADGTSCHYANLFLLDEPIFKGCTEATLKTYAESLVSFLNCLEQSNIGWKDVNKYDILMYRETMRTPDCGQPTLSSQTINLRLTVVESFYQWASLRFPNVCLHIEIESKSKETIEQNPYKSNLKKTSLIPRLRTFNGYSEIPTSVDALDFIATLSEPYDLMAKWQLLTGLRASGVRNLSLTTISAAKPCNQSAYKLLIKEKPSKPRFIYPPRFLIDETK